MAAEKIEIVLKAEKDEVFVSGDELLRDRSARLFFNSIIGGIIDGQGWRCPKRNLPIATLVVRINSFLETRGYRVTRLGEADEDVRREIERKRSFDRARHAAVTMREHQSEVDLAAVKGRLSKLGWNEHQRRLFPHQETGLIHALSAVNAANFSVPGAGKTATTLAIAGAHLAAKTIDTVIVVGPLSCFAPWEREARAALGRVLQLVRVRGSAAQRRSMYRKARQKHLLLLSYATAAADKSELIAVCRAFRVMLVIDESHRVKRFKGGVWAPALMELAKYARVRIALSGTPMPQSGRDLYSQLRILWPSGELTGPADDFALKVEKNFNQVLQDVRPFISRTPKDALGLEPYTVHKHLVELAPLQSEIYQLIESAFRRHLDDAPSWKEKLEALKRGRPIRLLQAAANPDLLNKIDGYYRLPRLDLPNPTLLERLSEYRHLETPAKSAKTLQLIEDVISRTHVTGGKIVCWSNFVHNLDQLSELIRARLPVPVFQIDGRVPTGDQPSDETSLRTAVELDTREAIIDRFLHTVGPAVLVANPASTSESISLHESCHNAIYLDRTYDCALFLQSIDRIHRLGLKPGQRVEVHIVLATCAGNDSIDSLVDQSLTAKDQRMRRLLEGADLAPLESPEDPLDSAEGNAEDLDNLLRYLLGEQPADEGQI
jgi:SNF2 family DNA or RNA helicase